MKKKLLLFILFGTAMSFGQTVTFNYDNAGNQINRVYNSFGNKFSSDVVKDYKDLTTKDFQKFFEEDVISYYPNPVKDELFLKWDLINDNVMKTIEIYNFSGQLLKSVNSFDTNSLIVQFSEYPTGTYLVQLNYIQGDSKSITIIKQ